MNYLHNPYGYGVPTGLPIEQQQIPYGMPIHPHPHPHPDYHHHVPGMEPFYGHHVPVELANSFYQAVTLEDTESLSRPRLTKEQVDTLEAQFQAHPKPNSSVKRQLAMQTNLTLPRVANWFQNRRAKAKQQKRQAEYEKKLAEEKAEKEKNERDVDSKEKHDDRSQPETAQATPTQPTNTAKSAAPQHQETASAQSPLKSRLEQTTSSQQATNIQSNQQRQPQSGGRVSQSNFEQHCATSVSPAISVNVVPDQVNVPYHDWSGADYQHGGQQTELPFRDTWGPSYAAGNNPADMMSGVIPMPCTPLMEEHEHGDMVSPMVDTPASSMETPATSVQISPMAPPTVDNMDTWRRFKKEVDIAARRKKPRPAAIGTATLGRSFTGPSSVSPTLGVARPGYGPGHSHTLRQTKSTQSLGHSARSRLSGIRKTSYNSRSPLNLSTFTEGALLGSTLPTISPLATPMTPDGARSLMPPTPNDAYAYSMPDCPSYAAPPPTSMSVEPESPPGTPFNFEYGVPRSSYHHPSFIPPRSAPPNQHGFPDGNSYMSIPGSAPGTAAGPSAAMSDYTWSTGSSLSPDTPHLQNPHYSHSQPHSLPHGLSQQHHSAAQHISPTMAYDNPFEFENNHPMIDGMNPLSPQGTIRAASPSTQMDQSGFTSQAQQTSAQQPMKVQTPEFSFMQQLTGGDEREDGNANSMLTPYDQGPYMFSTPTNHLLA
ncbi:hypothetical protein KEM56_005927 [Ascosphaera pollenicola]|nr:hypothetical protein KEM56_005927 [Ascosphaera pollenicola]